MFPRPSSLRRPAILFALGALSAGTAFAQQDQGAIVGTVKDATGAVIPGATLHLENKGTGFRLDRTADQDGTFTLSPLKIGSYDLTVNFAGFSASTVTGISVTASSRTDVPLVLALASTSTTVEVTAATPALQTDESSTGATVSAEAIVQTPLLNRNPIFIAQLTPGVVPAEQGSRGASKGDFTANGQRSQQNDYILDGIDNNSILVDVPNGASYVIKPLPEGLSEFKVQTSNYNAEFGRAAGAVVNASIKSGTNAVHGALWEYWRNDILNARDYFFSSKPKYRQNQFGATLGGPVIKNKLFLFGDVEANRIIFGLNQNYTVPTVKMRTGDFTDLLSPTLTNNNVRTLYVPGSAGTVVQQCNGVVNVICAANVDAEASKLLQLLPAPNNGLAGQTYNNYRFQANASDNTVQYDVRADWNISQKDQAFSRFSVINQKGNLPAPFGQLDGGGWGSIGAIDIGGRNFTISENHFFSSSLSNEFRFGYNYALTTYKQPFANQDLSSQIGLGGVQYGGAPNGGTPHFNMSNISSFGTSQYLPTVEFGNGAQLLDNVSKIIGRHSLRAGVDVERLRVQTLQPVSGRGNYNYDGKYTQNPASTGNTGYDVADLIQNQMDSVNISSLTTVYNQRWYRAGFAQDDWRVSDKLTFNIGVRYEYFQPQEERTDNQANFAPDYASGSAVFYLPSSKRNQALPAPLLAAFAANKVTVAYTDNRSLIHAQKGNFAPRIGFAYQGPHAIAIHGGYGIFYGGIESVGFSPNLGVNPPFSTDATIASGSCVPGNCANDGITLETGLAAQLAAGLQNINSIPEFRFYPVNVPTPMSQTFNLSAQKEISHNTVVTLSYVGALGRHLTSLPDANTPGPLAPGASVQANRPYNRFGASKYETYSGVSNYNGGQATVEHRLNNGLYFLGTYAYSKNLDDAFLPLGATNSSNLRNWRVLGFGYDYGPAFTDTRHRFVFNSQYQLPFGVGRKYLNHPGLVDALAGGWNLSLLFRVQTGQAEVVQPNNNPTNGGGNADAVRIADPYAVGLANPGTGVTCATRTRTVASWFNPCAFTNPPVATGAGSLASYGPPGKQVIFGPGYNRTDLSLSKDFHFYHETGLNLRADLFNALNTPAYGQPGNTVGSGFGQITSSRFGGTGFGFAGEQPDARVAQLSGKITF